MRVIVAGRLSRKASDRDQTGFDTTDREAVRFAEFNGHEIVATVADFASGRTAVTKRKNLRPYVEDPKLIGTYDAILALNVTRLTRGDEAETADLEAWARKHGKMLITVDGCMYPSQGQTVERIKWDIMTAQAHDEWLKTQKRYKDMHATLKAKGSILGRAPWGYRIVKRDGVKVFEATEQGRAWVPVIFEAAAEGKTARQICQMLDAQGVKPQRGGKWNEGFLINGVLKNTTYYGRPSWSGNADALVKKALFDRANAVMTSRARGGRSAVNAPKALLAPRCGNPECNATEPHPSPMYRVYAPYKDRKVALYRCTGSGPQRRGCGAPMIPCDLLDSIVLNLSAYWDERPYVAQRFVAGDDNGAKIEELKSRLNDAQTRAETNALWDEIEALEALGSVAPHWEPVETDMTEGDHLRSLDLDGQRAYLARKDIRAWKRGDTIVATVEDVTVEVSASTITLGIEGVSVTVDR